MTSFFSPHHGRQIKLGRNAPKVHPPKFQLANYLHKRALPDPPDRCDYISKARASIAEMYLNDELGDCVIAGMNHIAGIATGNAAGQCFIATREQIVKEYSAVSGYVAGDESTDCGCDEETAISYYKRNGFANGTKLYGAVAVDATNEKEVRTALWLFENLLFGIGLPASWLEETAPGSLWDCAGPSVPTNGHCVIAGGYGPNLEISTWGEVVKMTPRACAEYATRASGGQLYGLVTPDIVAKGSSKASNGVLWADLVADMKAFPRV